MSDMELGEVVGEKLYNPKDVVWVKLSGMWWPAEVQDQAKLDPEVTEGLKKPLLCVVQFLLESSYLHIKSLDQIYHYNCKKKMEFLKLGFKKYSRTKKEKNMAIWPDVIQEAERRTGGDPDIINDPEIVPVAEKPEAALNIYGARASLPGGVRRGQGQALRYSLPASLINGPRQQVRSTQHIRVYAVLKQNHALDDDSNVPKPEPKDYCCQRCHFTCQNLERYLIHYKMNHIFVGRCMPPPSTIREIPGPSSKPKKEKKRREETAAPPIIKKRKKKSVVKTKETTPSPLEEEDPPVALEVSQECEQILKDWDDEDDEMREGDRTLAFQEDSVVDDNTMSRAVEENSDTPVGKNDAPDDTGDSGSKNAQVQPPPPKTSSCFDFDDEEPAQPEVQSLKFGQKLPRVISLEKTKSSTVDALSDGRELESFLNEVAVPQLPSIPSNKHAYSPSKEPKGGKKSLYSPTNESVRKPIDKKKAALTVSSNRDLDDKKKVAGDEVVTSEENHFLAGGPLQSKKRKGSGLTEGAEDGSAGKKQKSSGDDEPSMINDIQSNVGGDEYENVGSQLYEGKPKPGLVMLGEVGDKASITTDLSDTKVIEPPPQSVTNDPISSVATSSKSKGTISELDKQSLIDTLTYSPSSVDTDTSQKKVKKKSEDMSLEDTQLDGEQERSEVVSEQDKQSLIDTLTHSPAAEDTGKSRTKLEQDQYKKSSRLSRSESSKTSDTSTLRRGSRVRSSVDSGATTSRSRSSRNSSHNRSKDKHSEVSPGRDSKSDGKSPKSKKSRRSRHEQDTKVDLETSNSPKTIGENDNNPKDRASSFSPKSKEHKIGESKKSFEINGAKFSPTRANDRKADAPSDKAQENISNESIKSGELSGTENTTTEKQSDPPSDENTAVIRNEESKLSSSEDRSHKNSPKNSGQNVDIEYEVSSRMCESRRHSNTSCIDTEFVDSIEVKTSTKEAKSDVNSENHIETKPSSPFSCFDSSKGDETLQEKLPPQHHSLNTSCFAENSKIFLEKNEFLEVSKLMPWKQNERPKPLVEGESGSSGVNTPQDDEPNSKEPHVDDMKKKKSPEVSRAEEPVQSQDKSHKSVFKTDLGTPKKEKRKGREKDTRHSKSSKHKSEVKHSKNSLLSEKTGSNEPSECNFTKYCRSKRTSRFDRIQDKQRESISSPKKSLPTSPDLTKDVLSKLSTSGVDKGHSRSMPSSQSRSSERHVGLKAKECSTKTASSVEGVSEDGGRTISDKRHSRSSRHTSKTKVDPLKSNSSPSKDREQTEGESGVDVPELVVPTAVEGLRKSNRSSFHDAPSAEGVSEDGGRTISDKRHSRSSRHTSKTQVDPLKSTSSPSKDREQTEGESGVDVPELVVPKTDEGLRRSNRSSSHDAPSAARVSEEGGHTISDKRHSRSSRHTSKTQVDLLKSTSSPSKDREQTEGESGMDVPELVVPKTDEGLRRSNRSSSHDAPSAERVSVEGGHTISDKRHSRSSRHTSKRHGDLLKSTSSPSKDREQTEGESGVDVPELVVPKAVEGLRRSNRSSSHDAPSAERVSEDGGHTISDKRHSRSSRHTSKTKVDLLKSNSIPSEDREQTEGESGVDVPEMVVPKAVDGFRRSNRSHDAPSAEGVSEDGGRTISDKRHSRSSRHTSKTQVDPLKSTSVPSMDREQTEGESGVDVPEMVIPKAVDGFRRSNRSHDAPSTEGVSEEGGRTISDKRHSRSSRHTSKTQVDPLKSTSIPSKDREQTEGESGVDVPELVVPKAVDGFRRSNRSSSHDAPSAEGVSEDGGRTISDKRHSRSSRHTSKTQVDPLKSTSIPSKDREQTEGDSGVDVPELVVPKAVEGLRRGNRSSSSFDNIVEPAPCLAPSAVETEDNEGQSEAETPGSRSDKDRSKSKLSSRSKSSHSITQESTPSPNKKAKSKGGVHSETTTHTPTDEGRRKQRRSSRSRDNLVITQKSPSSHDRSSTQHVVKVESGAVTPTASDGDGNKKKLRSSHSRGNNVIMQDSPLSPSKQISSVTERTAEVGTTSATNEKELSGTKQLANIPDSLFNSQLPVMFPHATDDSGQPKTKRPSRSLDSEGITCSLSNPSNDIGASSKDVGSRTEQTNCGKADDNLSPNQHEFVQTASPKTTCGATPSSNEETSTVVSKPSLFNESKEEQNLTPPKEFPKGSVCDDKSLSMDENDDLCAESCHLPSQEPKPEILLDNRVIGDHDAQVAPGGGDVTDNQTTKTKGGASAEFPVDPDQFIKEIKAPNTDSEIITVSAIGAQLENKSVATEPVSPSKASSKMDCIDLSMSQGLGSLSAASGVDNETMQISDPIDDPARILAVLQADEPPFKASKTAGQSCITPHVAVDSTCAPEVTSVNVSSTVHMKDESPSIVRMEVQNEEIASSGISKVESEPEDQSTLIVQTEEQEEDIGFGNTTTKETKSELATCKTSEADFTSPPMDESIDSQLKNCVLLSSSCSKAIGRLENEFETVLEEASSSSKDDVSSLVPHSYSGDDSKVEISTPVDTISEPSALHPCESGSPLKYVESPEESTESVKPTRSVPTLNVVLVSELPETKVDTPDESILDDKSSSALTSTEKLLTQTDLVNTSEKTKLPTVTDKGQKETLELPQVPVVTARASRWDNPFPTKKMDNRPLTPIQSFMTSPTKVGTCSLSPASKVKVEIKSGLGRNCFKSPPPDVKSAIKDAKPTQSESVESKNEDQAVETGILDTNLPEQTTNASDFDDELSALQAEIASYSESKVQDVPLKPDLSPETKEPAPRQEPSRVGVEDTENEFETTQQPQVSSRGQIMDLGNLLAFDIPLDSIPLPECPKPKPSTKETPLQLSKVPGQCEAALLASLLKGDEDNAADHEVSNAVDVASPPTEILKTELPATKTAPSSNESAVVVKDADNNKALGKTKSNLLSPLVTSLADLPVVISNIPLPQSEPSISSSDFDSFGASSESHQAPIVIPVEPPKVGLPDKHCSDNTPTSRVEVLEVERSQPQVGMAMGVIDPSKLLDLNDIPFVFEEDLIEEGLMPSETSSMQSQTVSNVDSLNVGTSTESALLDDKEITNTVTSSAIESEERFAIEDLVEEVVEEEPATDSTLSGNVVTENDYTVIESNENKVYEARQVRRYIIEVSDDSDPNFDYNFSLPLASVGKSASLQTAVDQPAVPAKKVARVTPIQPKRISTEPKYVSVGGTGKLVSGLSTASSTPQIIRVQAIKPGKPTMDIERQKVQIATGSTPDVQRSKEPLKLRMVKDSKTGATKFMVKPHMVQHLTRSACQKLVFSQHLKGVVKSPAGFATSNTQSTKNPSLIQINKTPKTMLRGATPAILSRGRTVKPTVPTQRPSSIPIQRPGRSKVATEMLVNSSTVRVPIEHTGLILTNNVLPEVTSTNQVLLSGSTNQLVLSSPSAQQTVPKFVSFVVNQPAEAKKPGKDLLEQALTGLDVQNEESTNMMPTATVVYGMLTDPVRQRPIMTTAVQPSQVLLSHDQLLAFQAPEDPRSTVSQSETNR